MSDRKNNDWLAVSEVAELLKCSVQNVHYLIKGRVRPNGKSKKITPQRFKKVKAIKIGRNLFTYFIHISEVEKYFQKEKSHESL